MLSLLSNGKIPLRPRRPRNKLVEFVLILGLVLAYPFIVILGWAMLTSPVSSMLLSYLMAVVGFWILVLSLGLLVVFFTAGGVLLAAKSKQNSG